MIRALINNWPLIVLGGGVILIACACIRGPRQAGPADEILSDMRKHHEGGR
jgi:hypothetical protein